MLRIHPIPLYQAKSGPIQNGSSLMKELNERAYVNRTFFFQKKLYNFSNLLWNQSQAVDPSYNEECSDN